MQDPVQWGLLRTRIMANDFPRLAVERVEATAGGNPERALPVFERESDVAAAQAMGIIWVVAIVGENEIRLNFTLQ